MPRDTLQSGTSARYLRHVPGGDGTLVGDGCPLDSGTGMILGSDANALRLESLRHLFSSLGPGALTAGKDGWSDLDEPTPDSSQRTAPEQAIAWGESTAMVFGPFPACKDDNQRAPGRDDLERAVKVAVTCKSDGTNTLTIYFAVTTNRLPPTQGYTSFEAVTTTSSSVVEVRHTGALYPTGSPHGYTAAGASDTGAGSVTVDEYFVWVGYELAAGTGSVISAEGWEVPTF